MLRIIVQIPLSTVRCSVSRMFSACVCPFCRKVLKKFESMNVSFVRDEITGLIDYMDKTFGKNGMPDSKAYLERIQQLY